MKHKLVRTQQLSCNIDTAWTFFSSPKKLECITPADMKFRIVTDLSDDGIYEGMIIDYKISPLLGIPISWKTIITQVDEKKSFTDFQMNGPYKLWNHFHEFFENEQGVLMKDTVDYELPMGVVGDVFHSFIVRKKLNFIFEHRRQILEETFNQNKKII